MDLRRSGKFCESGRSGTYVMCSCSCTCWRAASRKKVIFILHFLFVLEVELSEFELME